MTKKPDYYVKQVGDKWQVWDRSTGKRVPGYGEYGAKYAAERAVFALKRRS